MPQEKATEEEVKKAYKDLQAALVVFQDVTFRYSTVAAWALNTRIMRIQKNLDHINTGLARLFRGDNELGM